MSTTTRPLRVSLCKTGRERAQQGRDRTKEGLLQLLQPPADPSRKDRVCVTSHVTTTVLPCSSYLWPGIPQPYHWVNAAGGQEAVTGMRLETIHNRLVSLQHSDEVGGFFLPDEEGAVIRPTDNVLCIARAKGAELEITAQSQSWSPADTRIPAGFYNHQAATLVPMDPDKAFCVGSLHPQDSCFQS